MHIGIHISEEEKGKDGKKKEYIGIDWINFISQVFER